MLLSIFCGKSQIREKKLKKFTALRIKGRRKEFFIKELPILFKKVRKERGYGKGGSG